MVVNKTSLLQAVKLLDETIGALDEMSRHSKSRSNPQRVLLVRLRKARSLLQNELERPLFSVAVVTDVLKKVAAWLIVEVVINNIQCLFHPQAIDGACWGEMINDPRTRFEDVPGARRHQTEGACWSPGYLLELPLVG
jgi:hypothetical protein